jgi:uncharacterized Zn finger protein
MVEITHGAKMDAAIQRAKEARLVVRVEGFREYSVENRQTGVRYAVTFSVAAGRKFGACSCAAGERGMLCKHIAAAAARHLVAAAEIAAAQTAAPTPPTAREMDTAPVFKPTLPPAPKFRGVEL